MKPTNPYLVTLLMFAVFGLVIGVILLIIGAGAAGSYPYTGGSAQLLWGSAIAGVGATSLLLWLVAGAVTWKAEDAGERPSARELGEAFRNGLAQRGE